MTRDEANKIVPGVYRLTLSTEHTLDAIVGKNTHGDSFFCTPRGGGFLNFKWNGIVAVTPLVPSVEPAKPVAMKKCRAVLCLHGGVWQYATIVQDFSGVAADDLEDEIMKRIVATQTTAKVDRVFVLGIEDAKS